MFVLMPLHKYSNTTGVSGRPNFGEPITVLGIMASFAGMIYSNKQLTHVMIEKT